MDFTNFALTPDEDHKGECLGSGRFTVLAPTVGSNGTSYESLRCPERLEQLEKIDFLFPVSNTPRVENKRGKSPDFSTFPLSKSLKLINVVNNVWVLGDRCMPSLTPSGNS